jgi:hypothetical protein
MAGWHVNYEPFALSASHSLERISHSFVMWAGNKGRPNPFHKFNEPNLRKLTLFELL